MNNMLSFISSYVDAPVLHTRSTVCRQGWQEASNPNPGPIFTLYETFGLSTTVATASHFMESEAQGPMVTFPLPSLRPRRNGHLERGGFEIDRVARSRPLITLVATSNADEHVRPGSKAEHVIPPERPGLPYEIGEPRSSRVPEECSSS